MHYIPGNSKDKQWKMRSLYLLANFLQEEPFLKASIAIPLSQVFVYTGRLTSVIIHLSIDVCNSLCGTPSQETEYFEC